MEVRTYANLLCDFMFKRLFGSEENKDVLIWFLNMVLEDVDIVDVDFIPTEHQGLTEEDRKVIFDISCSTRDGKSFIIEMQKGFQRYFRERALYYTTYPINRQGRSARDRYEAEKIEGKASEKFNWDYNLKPVTVVAVLDFQFKHSDEWPPEMYRSSYRIREDTVMEPMTDVLRFVFLELGRFKKGIPELETSFEKWIYLLKNMHKMTGIPAEFSDPLFSRLFMLAEIGKFTADEKQHYYKSLENMGDYYNIISTAAEEAEKRGLEKGFEKGHAEGRAEGISEGVAKGRAEGRAEGISEGVAKGKAEALVEMARKMRASGMSVEQIVQITGLDPEVL